MKPLSRRCVTTGLAAAVTALPAVGALPAFASSERADIVRLCTEWCHALVATRNAHENYMVPGPPDLKEFADNTSRLCRELEEAIITFASTSPEAACLKLAFWVWYRHDFKPQRKSERRSLLMKRSDRTPVLTSTELRGGRA